ncbi:MAG: hypothetical protein UU05_C0029G0013 [Candidatus Curtissbacteria bacterium GW2011_GWA1_40_47]|uniref:Uncharacterized protein n=1 Tax=Candidatus Curtissbacteria bacterium RIFOXYA1_FULL_41_14 TaxID=1797737 RepID=A0A1F5HBA9_9BACT|nr:MAG: hypothetical protein UT95_C0016G0009 [Candidatus Curtissbacteria bacterium GW2011_GWB1_40_28]KKR61395.1 MAG: hypothetical protein UU00_C0014G0007 [Microgenomates group bacterium GW2011_GWC1_40_35]KKR65071.1 MAG: hypothetical protein UU05_C0029G0013 [Candidatus Curtissbacteria bacterium GW2011_GWA1_40_47]KKS02099.1 MAG: hypothetical protein UU53_C0004G0047 [Candidatus Curtissbacteria bacterium GW2011_GWC2_41_21]OGD81304.1 MAG: hypothetical protein A2683_01050 [Candidatus Curtissbacteria 
MTARDWFEKAQNEKFAIGTLRPFDETQGLRLRSGRNFQILKPFDCTQDERVQDDRRGKVL